MDIIGTFFGVSAPPHWTEGAVCTQTDYEIFFPEKGGHTGAPAKAICANCPVTAECLEYALAHRERFGVWGGLTPTERQQLKRRTA